MIETQIETTMRRITASLKKLKIDPGDLEAWDQLDAFLYMLETQVKKKTKQHTGGYGSPVVNAAMEYAVNELRDEVSKFNEIYTPNNLDIDDMALEINGVIKLLKTILLGSPTE